MAWWGLVADGLFGWLKSRQEIKKIEREGSVRVTQARVDAEVKRAQTGDEQAGRLDELSIQQRGWKDDYLLLLTTLPMAILFIEPLIGALIAYKAGALAAGVSAGFAALAATPQYYWVAVAIVYIDTFGFRRMFRIAVEKWLQSRFG